MTPQTLIYSNGIFYAWSDAQWTKDVATLTLNKIAGLQTPEPPVTPMPKPNEVWVWPMTQTPDVDMVQNATLIGTDEINGIKICKYDNPVLNAGRLVLSNERIYSIIVFPEGFQKQNVNQYWVFNQLISHLYLPSTFQYLGQRNFRVGTGGRILNVWFAWNEPQQYQEISTGYDWVSAYHVRAGLKATYVAAGWPEAKIVEDYEFNPWANITRGLAMGFESEEPTPDER